MMLKQGAAGIKDKIWFSGLVEKEKNTLSNE